MRVRDIVESAVAEAPPPRWTADEIVERSRRTVRRRRTTRLAAAGAVLAVAGVAGVVGVLREPPPVTPQRPAVVSSPPVAGPFVVTLAAYSVGKLQVREPTTVTAAYEIAQVRKGTKAEAGLLFLFRPGFYDSDYRAEGARPETVAGRPAWASPGVLAWEYGDDAWAVLTMRPGRGSPTTTQVRALAEKLRPGPPRAVRIPVRLGYVPPGYQPFEVRMDPDAERDDARATVRYASPAPAYRDLQGSWSIVDQSPRTSFLVLIAQNTVRGHRTGDVPAVELDRVLREARVADSDNPSTWPLANQLPSGQ